MAMFIVGRETLFDAVATDALLAPLAAIREAQQRYMRQTERMATHLHMTPDEMMTLSSSDEYADTFRYVNAANCNDWGLAWYVQGLKVVELETNPDGK